MVKKFLIGALLASGLAISAKAQPDFNFEDLTGNLGEALSGLDNLLGDDPSVKCGLEVFNKVVGDPAYQKCLAESFSLLGADGNIDCSKNPPEACLELGKKIEAATSPECKDYIADTSSGDPAAEIQNWEQACKDANANADDDDDDAQQAVDDAQQAVEDATNDAQQATEDASDTVADNAQSIIDDAKDAIASVTGGAGTFFSVLSTLAIFAALY